MYNRQHYQGSPARHVPHSFHSPHGTPNSIRASPYLPRQQAVPLSPHIREPPLQSIDVNTNVLGPPAMSRYASVSASTFSHGIASHSEQTKKDEYVDFDAVYVAMTVPTSNPHALYIRTLMDPLAQQAAQAFEDKSDLEQSVAASTTAIAKLTNQLSIEQRKHGEASRDLKKPRATLIQ